MASTRPVSPLLLLACVTAAFAVGRPDTAEAQGVVASDCNLDFQDTYNQGDAVCVTGDLDYVPPKKIFGEAYIYVIPLDSENPFADVSGAPNYIIGSGGGGSFIDEYVWLPPLKAGQYEFVIDNHPFFIDDMADFDPDKDLRTGQAFSVSNAPIVFSVDSNLIKAAALLALKEADALETLADALELIEKLKGKLEKNLKDEAKDALLEALCEELEIECPSDYNSWVLSKGADIMRNLAESQQKHFKAIIADPPDPNFKAVVGLEFAELKGIGYPWTPVAERTIPGRLHAMSQQLALQGLAYRAMVPSIEKVQGATQAGDNLWSLLHAEKLQAYNKLALTAGDAMIVEADALAAELAGSGILELSVALAEFNGWVDAVKQGGLDESDRDHLRSYGFDEAQIDQGAAAFAARPLLIDDANLGNLLKRVSGNFTTMKAALQDLDGQAEKVRAENVQAAQRPGPKLLPGAAPAGAKVGVASKLTADAEHFDPGAMLAFAWDLDLDGQFDDGALPSVDYVPTAPGAQIVAVQVSDGAFNDVAFIVVPVTISNSPPEVTVETPVGSAPFADVGVTIAFHVEASDPDGDPLTLAWTVDGAPAGAGTDLEFMMPDEQAHRVAVVIADNDPYSPDVTLTKVVRAGKWESMGGDTTGETSGDPTEGGETGTGGGPGSEGGEGASAPTEGTGGSDGVTSTGETGTGGTGTGGTGSGSDTAGTDGGSGCGCRSDAPGGAALLALALLGVRRRRR